MNSTEFEAIIPYKVQDLISLIIETQQLEFDDAVTLLYESKLYEVLSTETTKIWHLSTNKLLEILLNEKSTGQLIYPDYV
jgi:hypothetical protein